jgi:acyl-CoA synthetase (NDP forming)
MAMSGGEVALLSDLATEAGLPLAGLAPATRQALAAAFPPYTTIANPLDAWGAGWNPETHRAVARALLHDPGVSVVACALDPDARNGRASTPVARELAQIHLDLAREAPDHAAATVIFNNTSAALSPVLRELLDGSGVAYLQGTEEALRAIGHWVRFHQAQRRPRPISGELIPSDAGAPRPPAALAAYLQNRESRVLDEHASLALLAAYGIPVAPSRLARTAAEAARHAKAIGFPVVLKAVSSRLPHKSDVGAVMLDIRSATAARAAFNTIVSRAREAAPTVTLDGVLVARMASPGLELMLGASLGPYGAVVLVGHGGVDVETHRDVAHALAPVDAEEAEAMLARLRMFPLFGAARGRPARDVAAVIEMIVRLSRLAVDCGPRLDAIDVNPVIVQAAGAGACAVDGLVVLRRSVDGTPATDGRLDTHNVI